MFALYILGFALILAAVIAVPVLGGGFGKRQQVSGKKYTNALSIDIKQVQTSWGEIEATVNLGGPAQLKASVMDADKLVEQVLASKGLPGNTFADKLKAGKKLFKSYEDYDNLWFAHKVRNSIAHDNGVDFNTTNAKKAISYFRKALSVLGVL